MTDCPYCGEPAADVAAEVEHMQTAHPDIVAERLAAIGEPPPSLPKVTWEPDDALVIEVRHAAKQLGISFHDAVSFLVGIGYGTAQKDGLLGERALEPMEPEELFRRLAEYILREP